MDRVAQLWAPKQRVECPRCHRRCYFYEPRGSLTCCPKCLENGWRVVIRLGASSQQPRALVTERLQP